ncbi:glycine betaine ABC transporter substrate-binding protein [Aureimonas mangrovi]|uniref:glycine betaine ABC transporter substrate-binding protein n=1 Tax=Aureimonas mangrovi TaxID=2758041 RepID=UPI00163D798C|nr:glycine betaine ABC transporter substrate-binding protein [Aureimonas mangrovi]
MKRLLLASAAGFVAIAATPALAQDAAPEDCGTIRIASMNWASAETMAAIDQFILENGYDCDAQLVPGDTMPTFTSMTERGEPDVAPEMFVNQFRAQIDAAVSEGRIEYAAKVLSDGSQEGFWIPQYIADANPEIQTVADALARPDLFPSPENPDRGAFHDCPAGWGCQIMVGNLFRAYGGEDSGFDLVDTGSSAGLDGSIANAYENQRGWIGYYWSPTPIVGRYPMKLLDFGVPFDEEQWTSCTTQPDCADPQENAWTPADVYTLVTPAIAEGSQAAADYLNTRAWSNDVVNAVLAWKDENQATGEDTALHFLETQPDVWKAWVTPEAAEKVEAAL